jgi:hypothetical protein
LLWREEIPASASIELKQKQNRTNREKKLFPNVCERKKVEFNYIRRELFVGFLARQTRRKFFFSLARSLVAANQTHEANKNFICFPHFSLTFIVCLQKSPRSSAAVSSRRDQFTQHCRLLPTANRINHNKSVRTIELVARCEFRGPAALSRINK